MCKSDKEKSGIRAMDGWMDGWMVLLIPDGKLGDQYSRYIQT